MTRFMALALLLAGCTESTTLDPGRDAALDAAAARDAGPDLDAGETDAGDTDAGGRDAGLYPPGATGSSCERDEDCREGECLHEGVFPDGVCTTRCRSDTVCPVGSYCLPDIELCAPSCEPGRTDSCRPGYACVPEALGSGRPACFPGCYEDADCRSGRMCETIGTDRFPGACFTPEAPIGGACEVFADCRPGSVCMDEEGAGWPGGACVRGFGCEEGVALEASPFRCIARCDVDSDCRPSYRCATLPEGRACVPGCTSDAECTAPGHECVVSLGVCWPPASPSEVARRCGFGTDVCEASYCAETADADAPSLCAVAGCRLSGTGPSRACPVGSACVAPRSELRREQPALHDPEIGVCMPTCAGPADCPQGTRCEAGACQF
ncbi:MAG: hypothetical protein RLP09_29535 [Sandaracinaceae bacterium]